MKKLKYVILGGGITGLSFAMRLLNKGESSFVVLEKEQVAGGLCRTEYIEGAAVDIGGAHFLDANSKIATDVAFSFLPKDDWNCFERKSRVMVGKYEVGYPLESNIWQFPRDEQIKYLDSIANAGCQLEKPMPERFTDWIIWKFGKKIAIDYMLPYNAKVWSCDLDTLGTYWLNKLPDVSYKETLKSIKNHKPLGKIPGHSCYYYPKKYGYSILPISIAKYLSGHVEYNYDVKDLDWENKIVNNEYKGTYIINTLPWQEISSNFPDAIKVYIKQLAFTSLDIDYFPERLETEADLIYFADINLPYHRKINPHAFNKNGIGYWTETNEKRRMEISKYHFENKYAYPLNTLEKPQAIAAILKWGEMNDIVGLGRWGEWEHINSDVAIERAVTLANKLFNK